MQPHMSASEVALFERQLAGQASLLEFGCGGSTVTAARHVSRIVSVDSDPAWLAKVTADPALAGCDFTPFHADIGPVGEWGYPVDEARMRDWPRYHAQIWRHMSGSPDVVLIDGRFRVACALQSLIHCAPGCPLLVHDFRDRAHYHVVLDHADVIDQTDTLVVLRAKPAIDGKAVLHDLFDHFLIAD
jgi:hypothetical protein